jgi:hypothetical protein
MIDDDIPLSQRFSDPSSLMEKEKGARQIQRVFRNKYYRTHVPFILQNIVSYLKQHNITIDGNDEGRTGSYGDEGSVKKILRESPFKEFIVDCQNRKAGDILVYNYDKTKQYVVNIKSTGAKSADNAFSKIGITYALTSLELNKIKPMNFNIMDQLISTHTIDIPEKDYYFLCIDKNNSKNILCRGAKQIKNWKININPNNVMQIDWKREFLCSPVKRSWKESFDLLMGGAEKCNRAYIKNLPSHWSIA